MLIFLNFNSKKLMKNGGFSSVGFFETEKIQVKEKDENYYSMLEKQEIEDFAKKHWINKKFLNENELDEEENIIYEELEENLEENEGYNEEEIVDDENEDIVDDESEDIEEEDDDFYDEEDEDYYNNEEEEEEGYNKHKRSVKDDFGSVANYDLIFSNQFNSQVSKKLLTWKEEIGLFKRLNEEWVTKEEFDTIKKFIAEKNIGLIVSEAKKVKKTIGGKNIKFEDIVQQWVVWLFRAIERFEPERENKLSTYATLYVKQSMQSFISDNMLPVRITCHKRQDLMKINKIREDFQFKYNREPTLEEIQTITEWATSKMYDIKNLMQGSVSLDNYNWISGEWYDARYSLLDSIESETNVEDEVGMSEIFMLIDKALNKLTPIEKHLFQLFSWFENWRIVAERMKFKEIEQITGFERTDIRKYIKKAKEKIANELVKQGIDYWRISSSSYEDDEEF